MSTEHDVYYKWSKGTDTLPITRQIVADGDSNIDWSIPNGSVNITTSLVAFLLAKVKSIFMVCDQPITIKAGGADEVQRLTITGAPTGGTFTMTFGGNTTAAIPYNATASQVKAAYELLASVGSGNTSVAGGPLPGTPVDITYAGTLALANQAQFTTTDSLTGGTVPATAVSTLTGGAAPTTTINFLANRPLVWDSEAYFAQPFANDVTKLWATNASGAATVFKARTLSSA